MFYRGRRGSPLHQSAGRCNPSRSAYAGHWPELQPLRLVLHSAARLDASQDGNVIHVGLPPGEQVAVRYVHHARRRTSGEDGTVGIPSRQRCQRARSPPDGCWPSAARDGWMWWLTPDEELRLVHATARPAIAATHLPADREPRTPYMVTANLDGVLDVHGASTDKVELRAKWTEPVDDPDKAEPTEQQSPPRSWWTTGSASRTVLVAHRCGNSGGPGGRAQNRGADPAGHSHACPDTKARTVTYRLHGSLEVPGVLRSQRTPHHRRPAVGSATRSEVNVPSSAPPAPPVAHSVIPMFMWEQTTEPEHPFAVRRVRRSGVRIWLERPWYSSGAGEMLAVHHHRRPDAGDSEPRKGDLVGA